MSVYTHVPLIVLSAFGKWFLRNRPASKTAMYVSFITISKPNTECTRRYPVSRALISFQCFLALYGEKVLVAWLLGYIYTVNSSSGANYFVHLFWAK